MAEAVFHPPRRKRRVYESYDSPFPISSSDGSIYGRDYKICQAEIINSNVIVKNPEDIEQLYSKGFFGKGILSRSRPDYSISDPVLVAKWQDVSFGMPVVSSEKYQRHVEWAKSLMQEQGLDDYTINSVLQNFTKPLNLGEETEQNNESQDEETAEMEAVGNKPEDLVTFSETNGNKEHNLESEPPYALLVNSSPYKMDITDSKPVAKTHLAEQRPSSLHYQLKQDSCTEQKSHIWINNEYNHEYLLIQEEETNVSPAEAAGSEKSHLIKKEKLVCRRNPFKIFEYLQLSLEEAFFLVYALGCLSIFYSEVPLSILKLWEVFSDAQPNFKATYMAYHYFRSKGWVPKAGLKYGTDLLLYRKGPPFYHASYSVIVELINDDFEGSLHRPFSWKSLSGLNRTTANVSKELMFCYLIKPSDMTEKEMLSPECLKRIKVQELILNRWVSSSERSEQEEL
ncbi:tRNA-splicing endonuclease subunit Sen2 [Sceloporus undulatus]|uniref:tRNA-splicing endonuclease subunit Sen2 n=1 Tax=Sceloporus undulatus TaxID=8520 RepID=UPI001C4C8267|nr:tRNA-splicing endonuclease subunit Sen2 [Sceloporus undulatus]